MPFQPVNMGGGTMHIAEVINEILEQFTAWPKPFQDVGEILSESWLAVLGQRKGRDG